MPRLLAALALALILPGLALADSLPSYAFLSGSQEHPPNGSPGGAYAVVTYDSTAHTLEFRITFQDLSSPTTAANLHCCVPAAAPNPDADVATPLTGFPLGVTIGSYSETLDLTQAASWNPAFVTANGGTVGGAEAALAFGFQHQFTYLSFRTISFPGGEIRGHTAPTLGPEPGTGLLIGVGLTGLAWTRRRLGRSTVGRRGPVDRRTRRLPA